MHKDTELGWGRLLHLRIVIYNSQAPIYCGPSFHKYKTLSGLVSLSFLFLSNGERLTSTVLFLLGNLAVFERFFCQLQI